MGSVPTEGIIFFCIVFLFEKKGLKEKEEAGK
jgi:hypothetical protein